MIFLVLGTDFLNDYLAKPGSTEIHHTAGLRMRSALTAVVIERTVTAHRTVNEINL